MKKICQNCDIEFYTSHDNRKFCSLSCASIVNNRKKESVSEKTRAKLSESLRKYYKNNPDKITSKEDGLLNGISSQKGKNRNPKNILSVSKRSTTKILKRIGLGCSRCGWDKANCDLHHIKGKKINNPDNHDNLSYLCPNCHKLAHDGKVSEIKTLESYLNENNINWRDFYYG